ncbi:MAG TPA: hypothetical protein VLS49_11955 [Usitatibacter sp.]|nr:hypothetical protein [Usitatibacter sp.]
MVRNYLHTEFLPLEERIRRAGAERSVEVGYAIGDALAKLAHGAASLFKRRGTQSREHSIGDRLAAGD